MEQSVLVHTPTPTRALAALSERSASERAQQRAEAMVADELAAYRLAERRLTLAREELHEALDRAMAAGHTAYRLAQVTGLSQAWIGRLRMQATSRTDPRA